MLIEHMFECVIVKPEAFGDHFKAKDIKSDISTLITNLVKIESDFCQDRLLEIDIMSCILHLIHDARNGLHIT